MTPVLHDNDEEPLLRGLNVGETALLRRELDRQYAQRLLRVEERLSGLESTVGQQLHELERRLERNWHEQKVALDEVQRAVRDIAKQQSDQAPSLDVVKMVVQSGFVIRWLAVIGGGLIGSVITVISLWDMAKHWMHIQK